MVEEILYGTVFWEMLCNRTLPFRFGSLKHAILQGTMKFEEPAVARARMGRAHRRRGA